MPIAIEVRDRDGQRVGPGIADSEVPRGSKTAGPVTQKDRDVERTRQAQLSTGRDRQIRAAVFIEIGSRDRLRSAAHGKSGSGTEPAGAIAQKDRNAVRTQIRHSEVGIAVPVKVGGRNGSRERTRRQRPACDEAARRSRKIFSQDRIGKPQATQQQPAGKAEKRLHPAERV